MAPAKKRKRTQDSAQDLPPAKRPESAHHYPPAFWDGLSKVWLTPSALQEVDRRNDAQAPPARSTPAGVGTTDLARFARHGGPDLRRFRGFAEAEQTNLDTTTLPLSVAPVVPSKTRGSPPYDRESSPYDRNFEQHLVHHNIYPAGYRFPNGRANPGHRDADRLREKLSTAVASVSPLGLPEPARWKFEQCVLDLSKIVVLRSLVAIVAGETDILCAGSHAFTKLKPLTDEASITPVPDFFDGARSGSIDEKVRKVLHDIIVPTEDADAPVAPNFFLGVGTLRAQPDVGLREACYNGAYGARAMHSLQNYGKAKPTYDGKVYTYSSTYHRGLLTLYAHYVKAPTTPGGRPKYHMTLLQSYGLLNDSKSFVQGVTAFRNARDLARRYRDGFIQAANERARQD